MLVCFIVSSILLWIFAFAARISFCFKQKYKKYYGKLFEDDGVHKPYRWGLSRQENHNIYVTFRLFMVLFSIITVLFGVFTCDPLYLIVILTLPLVIVLPLGETIGKYLCKKSVKKQCRKFKIPFPNNLT